MLILLMCLCCLCSDSADALMLLSDFSLYFDHSQQSHHSIYGQVVVEDRCVIKKWLALRIVIGRYGYKSSFGANKE